MMYMRLGKEQEAYLGSSFIDFDYVSSDEDEEDEDEDSQADNSEESEDDEKVLNMAEQFLAALPDRIKENSNKRTKGQGSPLRRRTKVKD